MNREIKFRAWDGEQMLYRGLFDRNWYATPKNDENGCNCVQGIHPNDRVNMIVMQFTGLHDKHGWEIYEGDIVRVKFRTGEDGKYFTDAYYRVEIDWLDGIHLRYCRLVDESETVPDGELHCNQYPISTDLCVRYGTLTDDHRNGNHDRLAVAERWKSNGRQRWEQNAYSNDIEIIGNIYENHDLLKD